MVISIKMAMVISIIIAMVISMIMTHDVKIMMAKMTKATAIVEMALIEHSCNTCGNGWNW